MLNSCTSAFLASVFLIVVWWQVKIIKCLVENFVVDISFNQIGGLGTLCFIEEVIRSDWSSHHHYFTFNLFAEISDKIFVFQVDNLINQNHLLKRSIILIKSWCFYESRILGSYHGLLSTYALETLVIYVFHVYSSTFAGPLEVTNLFAFGNFYFGCHKKKKKKLCYILAYVSL